MFHLALHFLVPAVVAFVFFRDNWIKTWLVFMATMLVDLDHLLADPVYDPGRCSIGFHPLHHILPISAYAALCFIPRLRLIGIGLIIHMALDAIDCL